MIRYLLSEQYQSDVEFYEYLQERMEIESDIILSYKENGIILEADQKVNKTSWITKAKELIHRIFTKFIEKFTDTGMKNKMKWFKKNVDKFHGSIDYSGLVTNLSPIWKYSTDTMTTTMNNIISMLDPSKKPNANELDNLTDRDNVEKYKEFGKITINGKSFGESLKIKFSGGTTEEPKLVTVDDKSSPSFADVCVKYAIPFIKAYENNINKARASIKNYNNKLNIIERELNTRDSDELTESFYLIEDCYLNESSVFYLLEADENKPNDSQKTETQDTKTDTNDNPPKEGKVVDTKTDEHKVSKLSTKELQYYKICINLVQLTIATYLTELERRFNIYINLLQSTLNSRGTASNKEEASDKKDTKKKKK